jgi:hypothetical protein
MRKRTNELSVSGHGHTSSADRNVGELIYIGKEDIARACTALDPQNVGAPTQIYMYY